MKLGLKQDTPFLYREKHLTKAAGTAKMGLITIDPRYTHDKGLFYHELRHVQHWWVCTIMMFILSILLLPGGLMFVGMILSPLVYNVLSQMSDKFRYWIEVDCYAEQLKYYDDIPDRLPRFATLIANHYNLNVDKNKVVDDLLKKVNKWQKI